MKCKNKLLHFALRMLPIPKHPLTMQRRILVVTTTALGDTLWATPAIESLRSSWPNAYIAVLTSPIGWQVLQNNPWIDRLYPLREPLSLHCFSLWKTLYFDRFDTILLFHASQRLILPLCSRLGASQIVGTSGINKGLDALLTHPLPNIAQHEIQRRLNMVECIGAAASSETLSFFLRPEEKKPFSSRKELWIAIHPGSKDGFKRWPAHHFAAVGSQLKAALSCEIFITGTPSELALMKDVAAQIPGAHLMDPHLSLRSFAAELEQMDLLISNDTGPVHLACALRRPVLAIYSSTDPHLCGPYKALYATALYKRRTCEPCLKRRCRRPFCLLQISIQEAVLTAQKMLAHKKSSPLCSAPLHD